MYEVYGDSKTGGVLMEKIKNSDIKRKISRSRITSLALSYNDNHNKESHDPYRKLKQITTTVITGCKPPSTITFPSWVMTEKKKKKTCTV